MPDTTEPTKPGFYRYSGGVQNMIFLLRSDGRWFTVFDSGVMSDCTWTYIEQALGVWDLLPIDGPVVDYEPLGEDVTFHHMKKLGAHADGRRCWYHDRLSAWAFKDQRGRFTQKCLREHNFDATL